MVRRFSDCDSERGRPQRAACSEGPKPPRRRPHGGRTGSDPDTDALPAEPDLVRCIVEASAAGLGTLLAAAGGANATTGRPGDSSSQYVMSASFLHGLWSVRKDRFESEKSGPQSTHWHPAATKTSIKPSSAYSVRGRRRDDQRPLALLSDRPPCPLSDTPNNTKVCRLIVGPDTKHLTFTMLCLAVCG